MAQAFLPAAPRFVSAAFPPPPKKHSRPAYRDGRQDGRTTAKGLRPRLSDTIRGDHAAPCITEHSFPRNWISWRRHSCLQRRDSSRRPFPRRRQSILDPPTETAGSNARATKNSNLRRPASHANCGLPLQASRQTARRLVGQALPPANPARPKSWQAQPPAPPFGARNEANRGGSSWPVPAAPTQTAATPHKTPADCLALTDSIDITPMLSTTLAARQATAMPTNHTAIACDRNRKRDPAHADFQQRGQTHSGWVRRGIHSEARRREDRAQDRAVHRDDGHELTQQQHPNHSASAPATAPAGLRGGSRGKLASEHAVPNSVERPRDEVPSPSHHFELYFRLSVQSPAPRRRLPPPVRMPSSNWVRHCAEHPPISVRILTVWKANSSIISKISVRILTVSSARVHPGEGTNYAGTDSVAPKDTARGFFAARPKRLPNAIRGISIQR